MLHVLIIVYIWTFDILFITRRAIDVESEKKLIVGLLCEKSTKGEFKNRIICKITIIRTAVLLFSLLLVLMYNNK